MSDADRSRPPRPDWPTHTPPTHVIVSVEAIHLHLHLPTPTPPPGDDVVTQARIDALTAQLKRQNDALAAAVAATPAPTA